MSLLVYIIRESGDRWKSMPEAGIEFFLSFLTRQLIENYAVVSPSPSPGLFTRRRNDVKDMLYEKTKIHVLFPTAIIDLILDYETHLPNSLLVCDREYVRLLDGTFDGLQGEQSM